MLGALQRAMPRGRLRRPFNALNVCYRRRADAADWAEEPEDSGLLNGAEPAEGFPRLARVRVAGSNPVVRSTVVRSTVVRSR